MGCVNGSMLPLTCPFYKNISIMTFKDLKPGYQVYILRKDIEGFNVNTGKVVNISPSRFPQSQGNFQAMQMVVDVTIEENGASKTYTTPDSLSVTYAGNELVIATERDGILREVENIKAQSEEELSKTEQRRNAVAQCEKILMEWNPVLAEKKRQEERIGTLEKGMGELKEMVRTLVNKLS